MSTPEWRAQTFRKDSGKGQTMTIKIAAFEFGYDGDEETNVLEVRFEGSDGGEAIRFLSALGQFVEAYMHGGDVRHLVATETPKTRAAATKKAPAVVEAVTPPLEALPPKAPPAGSAPPAVTSSAPVSSPTPVPTAPTASVAPSAAAPPAVTPPSAPVAPAEALAKFNLPVDPSEFKHEFNPQQGPISLVQMKSFREVLTALFSRGISTQADVEAVCRAYANTPVISRLLQPNPDPEASIEKRIELGLSVLSRKTSA
jgi:hypothetical protein